MDIEKLKQWMEIAQNMHGGDFWKNIFDQDFANPFINEDSSNKSPDTKTRKETYQEEKASTTSFPFIEISEGEEEVMVTIELPGVKKENVELGLSGNVLTVKGTNMPIHPELKHTYSERFYGEFKRQITIPDVISPQDLTAKFWNGLLLVSYQRSIKKMDIIPIE